MNHLNNVAKFEIYNIEDNKNFKSEKEEFKSIYSNIEGVIQNISD